MSARIANRPARTEAILRAAAEVLAEQGYEAATIDAIAARAGVGKGTVYQYFRNKQELFFAVFDSYIASMEALARNSLDSPSETAAEGIARSIHNVLAMSAEARDMFPLVFEFWSASASPDRQQRVGAMFRETYAKFRVLIAGQIRRGQKAREFDRGIDADGVAAALVGALDGLFLQAWFDAALDPVTMGDTFVGVVLRGLAAADRSRRKPVRKRAERGAATS
jgi:AcrR family transcriptional regulator